MSRKGRAVILASILAAVLLGLYRNLVTPVFRFWPLILVDTLTRFPGDRIIELLHLRVTAVIYELIRGLLQLPMISLFAWGGEKLWRFPRSGRKTAGAEPAPKAFRPPTIGRFGKMRPPFIVLALLASFLAIPRCGRRLTDLASFLTGIHPYSLIVQTRVYVEGPEHMLAAEYSLPSMFSEILPSGDPRVPGARAFQDTVLNKNRISAPLVKPGRMSMERLPPGVSQNEAVFIDQRALDIINAFLGLDWTYSAEADLVFSVDGDRATYKLYTYSYDGPLAAIGFDYVVEFVKVKGQWVATKFGGAGAWLS